MSIILSNNDKNKVINGEKIVSNQILKLNKLDYIIEITKYKFIDASGKLFPDEVLIQIIDNMNYNDIENLKEADKRLKNKLSESRFEKLIYSKQKLVDWLNTYSDINRGNYTINNIENVVVTNADFYKIPPFIKFLKNIKLLDLSHNLITKIENLDSLNHLRTLILSHNHIRKIENLYSLVSLEYLDLSYNPIEHVENINTLKLNELILTNTPIKHININELPETLRRLDISDTNINRKYKDKITLKFLKKYNKILNVR